MTRKNRNTMISAIALVLALASSGAARAEVLWSSIGAAGTPDDGSLKSFDARRASVWIKSDAALPATVVARYNISPGELLSQRDAALVVDLFDNGDGSSVTVQLFEVDLQTGLTGASAQPKLTVDSDALDAGTLFQRGADCQSVSFDFENNAYFILVTLSRTSSAAQPGLRAIQLVSADSCE